MAKYERHREFEVYLTTYDGTQHLRLHGWLKRNDVLIKAETIQNESDSFGTFIVYINDILLEKIKIENMERGLYCDIEVMNSESDRWNIYQGLKNKDSLFDKIQDFMFSFQIKDREDIDKFLKQANNTSIALFKKDKDFIDDYIKTDEMSYSDKVKDLDLMIEAFVEEERYEDCAILVNIKEKMKKHYLKIYKTEKL
jgi:hypothetical protein